MGNTENAYILQTDFYVRSDSKIRRYIQNIQDERYSKAIFRYFDFFKNHLQDKENMTR